jgi:hypothetical protein
MIYEVVYTIIIIVVLLWSISKGEDGRVYKQNVFIKALKPFSHNRERFFYLVWI